MNSLQLHSNRYELHNNTDTADSDNDLAFAKTENLYRFLSRSSRVKITSVGTTNKGFRVKRHTILKRENSSFEWYQFEYDAYMFS